MAGQDRTDPDTIRTHIDEVGRRLEVSVKSVHARINDVDKALRDRVESRAQISLERFERHSKQDERDIGEIKEAIGEIKETARESQKDMRNDVKEVAAKVDALAVTVNALALKGAEGTGKIAGVVSAAVAFVGVVGWLLDRFVLPH